MSTKLYVGNLPYETTESDLQALFEVSGPVSSVNIVRDRATGQARGFAFVEMGSQSEVQKAISMFNSYTLNDRQLTVNMARPREERGGGGGFRPQRSGGPRPQQRGGKERRRY